MRVHQKTFPSPSFSVQEPIRQSIDINVGRNVSVVKSTNPNATKWWYSFVCWEWGVSVSVRVISVGSVGRVQRGLQGKGNLVANTSQKASQIPFFEYQKKPEKSQPPAFQSPYVIHPIVIIQHPLELRRLKWQGTRLWQRWYDRSNSFVMYIGLKSVLNWGHIINWGHVLNW